MKLKSGLPTIPVDDILIHPMENDLILATHGRSVWILDNLAALTGMTEAVARQPIHLFENQTGTQWRMAGVGASNWADRHGPHTDRILLSVEWQSWPTDLGARAG